MKKLIFASMFLSCAIVPKAQVPSLQEGLKHLENENFSAALNTFNAIAKNDPKNGTIYYYIGEVSYETEDYTEAEKSYKKGLSINPRCAECKIGLGKLQLDQGKIAEAEENFASAARLDSKNPEIYALIGEAYLFNKKPNGKKAEENLLNASNKNPKVARYLAHLGDAYKLNGNNGEAMTAYERAVALDPTYTSAYISMARIWAGAKQYDTAIQQLLKAIQLSPNDALPYKDLIELYIRTSAYDKVTPLLEKYISLTGSDVDAKVRLVKFLTFQAQDYDRAIEEGEKLLLTNPDQYTLHRWLAWAYFEKEQYQKSHDHSVTLFDKIGKKEGRASFPSDYEYWAKASLKLGMVDEAAHVYRKYLDLDPTRKHEIYGILASAYYAIKNYEQAIAYYIKKGGEKQLSVTDDYYMGIAYWNSKKHHLADSSFARVVEVRPEYITGHWNRARIAMEIDTAEVKQFLAKEHFENYLLHALVDKGKNKDNIIDAANYLGYYWTQMQGDKVAMAYYADKLEMEFTPKTWDEYCFAKAAEYYRVIIDVDPQNELAAFNLKILENKN